MARYVTLYQFTDQGIRAVKDSPKRLKAAIETAKSFGIQIVSAWYTSGAYDLVIVSECESEEIATAFTLAVGAAGNVRSTTMRAFDADEFSAIVSKIP